MYPKPYKATPIFHTFILNNPLYSDFGAQRVDPVVLFKLMMINIIFGIHSILDMNNRMVVYDICNLGAQLKTLGLLVVTDSMLNRVSRNWRLGKRTHVFIDELHVVFENEYSANFFT